MPLMYHLRVGLCVDDDQILLANFLMVGLSSVSHASGVIPFLSVFVAIYGIELVLRVLAEDVPHDFW